MKILYDVFMSRSVFIRGSYDSVKNLLEEFVA